MSQPSLRRTLLIWLVPPLSLISVLGSFAAFQYSHSAAMQAFDQSLVNAAIGLGGRVRMHGVTATIDIPIAADQIVRTDQYDEIFYLIRDPYGEMLAGDPELPAPPPDSNPSQFAVIYDSFLHGKPVRVAAVRAPCGEFECAIMVGETMINRTQARNRILAFTFVPEMTLLLAALLFVWIGVRRGIEPLARLSDDIRARSPADLRPIDSTRVPSEARPIVTELNSLFARVNAATANQKRFTANAAHQLRTPLAVLQTHLELAMLQPASAELNALLQYAHSATARATRLTHQLLTLARAEPSSQHSIGHESVDLCVVAEGLADELIHRALARSVDLGFELEAAPISGDRFTLSEALSNVVLNAIEYVDEGGHVTVRSGVAAAGAFIEVDDNGPGIPLAERDRVLERFYRIPNTPGVGSGLGLAIVREIVQLHGGTLALLDGESGRGCRVRMTFPAIAAMGR